MRRARPSRRRVLALGLVVAGLLLVSTAQAAVAPDPSVAGVDAAGRRDAARSDLAVASLLLAFVLLVLLPFAPGVFEIYRPRDQYPLPVNTEYVKDPRYLGRSAWAIVGGALADRRAIDGRHEVRMSKSELVEVSDTRTLPARSTVETLLYVRGDLALQEEARCGRDLFVEGSAHLARGSQVRALACRGDVTLRGDCRVTRWLDAEGSVEVGPGCSLGVSLATPRTVRVGEGTTFHRLYGDPIETSEAQGIDPPLDEAPSSSRANETIRTIEDVAEYHAGDHRVAAGGQVRRPLVVRGDLTVGERAVLLGPLRVAGRTRIARGAVLHGDLFSEGPVELADGVVLAGNLFSQEDVTLGRGVRVGRPTAPKSVVARAALRLDRDVRIYGYVLAEGRGSAL